MGEAVGGGSIPDPAPADENNEDEGVGLLVGLTVGIFVRGR